MADTITMKVEGLQELGEALRLLSREVAFKVAWQATAAGALIIKKQAIVNAPIAPKAHKLEGVIVPPGNLKKNIVTKKWTKTSYTAEHIVVVRGKRKDAYAARYGRLVEYGTVNFSPQPFMRTAFDQEKGFAVGKIKQKLTEGIAKANKLK